MQPAAPQVFGGLHHAHSQGHAIPALLHKQPGSSGIVQVQQHLQVSSSQETILAQLADNGGDMDGKRDTHPHTLPLLRKDHPLHIPKHERMRERKREGGEEEEERKEGTGR